MNIAQESSTIIHTPKNKNGAPGENIFTATGNTHVIRAQNIQRQAEAKACPHALILFGNISLRYTHMTAPHPNAWEEAKTSIPISRII